MREFIKKQLMPPLLLKGWGYIRGVRPSPFYGLTGNYQSFEDAKADAAGYETDAFGSRELESLRAILSAPPYRVLDERFMQVHSALSYIVQQEQASKLSILDYGGGPGVYAKVMRQLMPATSFDWVVQESEPVVAACKEVGAGHASFISVPNGRLFDVAIISGTLHYLRDPWAALEEILTRAKWTILTRVPVSGDEGDRVMLQITPPHLHPPSVPYWIFSEEKLRRVIGDRIVLEWIVSPDAGLTAMGSATPMGFLIRS
jgi:putative methyltransferase (TIGR04325 family)